jgi:exopolysaccharide/PEP-CTERM locus tyrosine autokinase
MSRIEKAIEIATRKRNKAEPVIPPPISSPVEPEEVGQGVRPSSPEVTIQYNNPYLITANQQNSPASEQYRKLKSLIVKLSQMGELDRAMMVTSPIAGEGKTLTSLNLAITMAQEFDHTVLLIEADVRKPSVLKYLGLESQAGLTDCVLDGLDVSEVLIKTGIGSLSILPSGRKVANPVELFSSNRMDAIMNEIKQRYKDRYIIVDTTPLLPFAEPQYIANLVGAVLLVVREGITTPEKLKRSLEILKNNNLLGIVSNGFSRVNSLQGYYGYYGYHQDAGDG